MRFATMKHNNRYPLILISGSGSGAGKTTLAKRFKCEIATLADGIRGHLKDIDPNIDWFNKDQVFKDSVLQTYGCTVRDVLLKVSLQKIAEFGEAYWCEFLFKSIIKNIDDGPVAIDDVRKLIERSYFVDRLENVIHFHVQSSRSKYEAFDNEALRDLANYVLTWDKG
jgi:hypothetical protein